MVEIVCAVIAAISAIMVAVIGARSEKATKRSEERAQLRARESLLALELMNANTRATEALVIAMQGGHNNGNVEQARQEMTSALKGYEDFHKEIIAKQISK